MDRDAQAVALNAQMVATLKAGGRILTLPVEQAFLTVLRHRLLPDSLALEAIYRDETIVLKNATSGDVLPEGRPLASSTMPGLLARLLEASAVRPGMRILQIGTGPGYLAALLAVLVTSAGRVTTLEIDPTVAEAAATRLESLGLQNLSCRTADGWHGLPQDAPYDRVVATASCADLPDAWISQLRDDGLILVPFALSQRASMYPVVCFRKDGQRLVGQIVPSLPLVGFIPLYGSSVPYPVLYEQRLSKMETELSLALGSRLKDPEQRRTASAALVFALADAVQRAGDLRNIDVEGVFDAAMASCKSASRPRIEDYSLLLLPKGTAPDHYLWRFEKHSHDLFVQAE